MKSDRPSRRTFLEASSAAALALAASGASRPAKPAPRKPHLATNEYPWRTFDEREGRRFRDDLADSMKRVASSGVVGFEPLVDDLAHLERLEPLLERHDLEMRSIYVNSVLHDPARVKASQDKVVEISRRARELGAKIVVTNPSPIRWGGPENKSDAQLELQGRALDELGARLKELGVTLAYHNHDAELRLAAREFHHMLVATDPANVALCLDSHWVFRGAGDSSLYLFDMLEHYGKRIVELHLRQSRDGVWTEAFGPGDIDYARLVAWLGKHELEPHLVLEQAVEKASPRKLDVVTAHRQSVEYARKLFT